MPGYLSKEQIAKLSIKQIENRVFVFDSSPADEKYFRNAMAQWVADQSGERSEFREFLWWLIFARNHGGASIKYLHFNERAQKVYLDWYFIEWARRATDEIEATLEKLSAPQKFSPSAG